MKNLLLWCVPAAVILLGGCQKDPRPSPVEDAVGNAAGGAISMADCPFADSTSLMGLIKDPDVVDYELARKLVLIELKMGRFIEELGWQGMQLHDTPIPVFDLNGRPRYYDFIVHKGNNVPIGFVRAHATRNEDAMIAELGTEVPDYRQWGGKLEDDLNKVLYMDWCGTCYVGQRSAEGKPMGNVVNSITGELLQGSQMHDPSDDELLVALQTELLPFLCKQDPRMADSISASMSGNENLRRAMEEANKVTLAQMRDSMAEALVRKRRHTKEFWDEITPRIPDIRLELDDDLINEPKFLGRWFRRLVTPVDRTPYHINWYTRIAYNDHEYDWCGPWVCGFIYYASNWVDKYDYFESCASTVGELGILNFSLRLVGRPMTPVEMAWSMAKASGGKIWIDPTLKFADVYAYDQIRYKKSPAIRLCAAKNDKGFYELHWTVALGARMEGVWAWKKYRFMQRDNSTRGPIKRPDSLPLYKPIDWWNPWLMVWDS